jgi:hypothetical protein
MSPIACPGWYYGDWGLLIRRNDRSKLLRTRLPWLRKCQAAWLHDCEKDPATAKHTAGIENQAASAVNRLRKRSETLRAANRHELLSRGIVTVSLDPYRFRRVAIFPPLGRPGLHYLYQISHTAALLIMGHRPSPRKELIFRKHAAHRDHIDGREPAVNDGEQFKARHCRHIEVGKQDVRNFLANLNSAERPSAADRVRYPR